MRRFALLLPMVLAAPAFACPPAPGQFAPNCANNGDRVDGFGQFFLTDLSRPEPPGGAGQSAFPVFLVTLPAAPPDTGLGIGRFSNLWAPDETNSTAGPPRYQVAPGVAGRPPGEVRAGDPVRDNRTGQVIGTVESTTGGTNEPRLPAGAVLPSVGEQGGGSGLAVRLTDGRLIPVFSYAVGTDPGPPPPLTPVVPAVPAGTTVGVVLRANGSTVALAPPAAPVLPGTAVGAGTLVVRAGADNVSVPVTIVRRPDGSLVAVDDQGVVRGTAEERKAGPFGLTYKLTPLPNQPPVAAATAQPPAPAAAPPPPPASTYARLKARGTAFDLTAWLSNDAASRSFRADQAERQLRPPSASDRATAAPSSDSQGSIAEYVLSLQIDAVNRRLVEAVQRGEVPGEVVRQSAGATTVRIPPEGLDAARPYLDVRDQLGAERDQLEREREQVREVQPFGTVPPPRAAAPPAQAADRAHAERVLEDALGDITPVMVRN